MKTVSGTLPGLQNLDTRGISKKRNIYSSSVYNFLFATIDNDPIRQNIYKLWERKGKCYEGLKR